RSSSGRRGCRSSPASRSSSRWWASTSSATRLGTCSTPACGMPDALRLPLRLAPRLVPRVWGGGRLPALHGVAWEAPAGSDPVGESWLADGASVVAGGPFEGATVAELAERYGRDLLGEASVARYGRRLALLV